MGALVIVGGVLCWVSGVCVCVWVFIHWCIYRFFFLCPKITHIYKHSFRNGYCIEAQARCSEESGSDSEEICQEGEEGDPAEEGRCESVEGEGHEIANEETVSRWKNTKCQG